jgi:hypothetical protein
MSLDPSMLKWILSLPSRHRLYIVLNKGLAI